MYCVMEEKVLCDLDGFLLKKSELAIHAVTTWVAAVFRGQKCGILWCTKGQSLKQ